MKLIGYVNIYRSGLYHSPGKPGAYDRHPGDIYATEVAAKDDIYPRSHYVATVPVEWEEATTPYLNPVPPVVCTMRDPLPITPRETPSPFAEVMEVLDARDDAARGEYLGLSNLPEEKRRDW